MNAIQNTFPSLFGRYISKYADEYQSFSCINAMNFLLYVYEAYWLGFIETEFSYYISNVHYLEIRGIIHKADVKCR